MGMYLNTPNLILSLFIFLSFSLFLSTAFLKTLEPEGLLDKLLWAIIMACTWTFFNGTRAVGNTGTGSIFANEMGLGVVSYLLFAGAASFVASYTGLVDSWYTGVFVPLTSFIHYGLPILFSVTNR